MKTRLMTTALAGLLALATPAAAKDLVSEDMLGGEISANIGFTTEYFFRGLTQSGNGSPAVQGGFDFEHGSGFYLGTWGSSINFGGNLEVDFYGGWTGPLADSGFDIDVGLIYYLYPSQQRGDALDFLEGYVGISRDFEIAAAGVQLNYSPSYTANSGDAYYLAGHVDIPLGEIFTANLHLGHQWVEKNNSFGFRDYTDWLVGVSFGIVGFDAQIAYLGNDMTKAQCGGAGCNRLVGTLTRSF